jgi:hypothetical protein
MAQPPSPKHAALALVLACQACATTGSSRSVDLEVARSVRVIPTERALARVQQSGHTVTLHATRACDLRAVRTVDRTERRRVVTGRASEAAFPLLVVGNALGVAGAITFHASLATSEEHLERDLATAGVIFAIGAVFIGAGIVAAHKPTRTDVTRARLDLDGGLVSANVPCAEANPAAHVPVTGKMLGPPALEIPFGDTDAEGSLVVNLLDALPRALVNNPPAGATLTLYLGELEVGTARVDPAMREPSEPPASEEEKHRATEACEKACASSCKGIERCTHLCVTGNCQ